jgi:DNA-binding response OmpR family regulator
MACQCVSLWEIEAASLVPASSAHNSGSNIDYLVTQTIPKSDVLIVDDEAALRRLVRRVVERDGAKAVVAGVRAGSRVYLVKPVALEQLRDTLKTSLEEHATRVRSGFSTRRAPLAE